MQEKEGELSKTVEIMNQDMAKLTTPVPKQKSQKNLLKMNNNIPLTQTMKQKETPKLIKQKSKLQ